MSHIINKIEVAATVRNENLSSEDFPREIKVYIDEDEVHNFNLGNDKNISRDNLSGIILSTDKINFKAEDEDTVEVVWGDTKFYVHINDDDRCYDHILTDVIYNDRSIKIPKTRYSVCTFARLSGGRYAELYITLHTQKKRG